MPYRFSQVDESRSRQWLIRRNCALTPRQLGWWFGTLAMVSVAVAGFFAAQGAWLVVPFTGIELLALGTAFVAYARQAGDYERVLVTPERIVVERWAGGRLARQEVGPEWARFEYEGGRRGVIRLVAGRTEVAIGSFLPEESREQLVRELRASLAGGRL